MAKKKTIVEEIIPDSTTRTSEEGAKPWVKIKVYKIVPGLPQPQYCFSRATDIDEEGLQASSYGGGRYEVQYCDVDGQVLHTINYEIAAPPAPNTPLTPETIQIQMLREQSQMNRDLLMAVLGTGSKAQTPMSDLANMWSIMHGTAGNNGTTSLVDVFIKGLELAGKMGDTDWKTALIQSVRDVIPPVATAIAAHGKQPIPPGLLPQVPPTNGGTMISGSQFVPQAPIASPDKDALLKAGLVYIKPRIMAGIDPGLVLEWITTNANDPTYEPFVSFAMSKTFDDLVAIDPDIANDPYKSWFQYVLNGIKEHLKELSQPNDESK